ncbi:MAG: nicotinamide riboside transporter PnuC [Muribaculaceae bacterium]|nr:nicotinamide riboside transporter PnuC [Muribaculaceae bacterium]
MEFITAHGLEILGFIVGLAYLWFEYHANRMVWLASIIMPAISLWVYLSKGLYADFAINIYYLLIAVYGYAVWSIKGRKESGGHKSQALPISHLKPLTGVVLLVIFIILDIALTWVLLNFTDSTVPYADAFTTALSIVALWMMARKIAEQWLVWFVVDLVCVALYFYKDIPFYAVLYAVYCVIALFGYRKWVKMITAPDSDNMVQKS